MKTIIYILTILTIVLLSNETKACTCIGESTVKDEIKNKDAVFVGAITDSEELRIYDTLIPNKTIYRVEMKFTMVIETIYKGRQISDTTFIFTGSGGGDCGFNFQIGQKYIVYAGHFKTANRYNGQVFIDKKSAFYTTICTRTRKYQDEEINEIERHLKQKKLRRKK